jgi:hypothetical protein
MKPIRIDRAKIPADKLAAAAGTAAALNSPEVSRMMALASELSRRVLDPNARNHPTAARVAAGFVDGSDLLPLLMAGILPKGFLASVERMATAPSQDNRESCLLAAVLDFWVENDSWPTKAGAARHAIALFPEIFEGIADLGNDDNRKSWRRLRDKLALDFLTDGNPGRPA